MSLVFTQTDLDNLKEALVSGADMVIIGDRTIKFRSKKELLELIDMVQKQLDGDDGSATENTSVIVGGFKRNPDDGG